MPKKTKVQGRFEVRIYSFGAYTNSQWYMTEAAAQEAARQIYDPYGSGFTAKYVPPKGNYRLPLTLRS